MPVIPGFLALVRDVRLDAVEARRAALDPRAPAPGPISVHCGESRGERGMSRTGPLAPAGRVAGRSGGRDGRA